MQEIIAIGFFVLGFLVIKMFVLINAIYKEADDITKRMSAQ